MDVVTAGLMDIYQRLLGLRFRQVAGEVWHEDVQLWQVEDVATSENLGNLFVLLGSAADPGWKKNRSWIRVPQFTSWIIFPRA